MRSKTKMMMMTSAEEEGRSLSMTTQPMTKIQKVKMKNKSINR